MDDVLQALEVAIVHECFDEAGRRPQVDVPQRRDLMLAHILGRERLILGDGFQGASEPGVHPGLPVRIVLFPLPKERVFRVSGDPEVVVRVVREHGRLVIRGGQDMTVRAQAFGVEKDETPELGVRQSQIFKAPGVGFVDGFDFDPLGRGRPPEIVELRVERIDLGRSFISVDGAADPDVGPVNVLVGVEGAGPQTFSKRPA